MVAAALAQGHDQTFFADTALPLVVDLDGTLILTDSLHEGFLKLMASSPGAALASLATILRGKAAFKTFVAARGLPDIAHLPVRGPLLDLLRQERARGRAIHLVTAADQTVAEAVAAELGVFDGAIGSDGTHNLKGRRKADALRRRFPDGFIYAGDCAADVPVFLASRGAILCDAGERIAAELRAAGVPILASFDEGVAKPLAFVRALRAHQWMKNVLIFVPLIVGHAFGEIRTVIATATGFAILCLLASATYMINDLADLAADRQHPVKRLRPFASGQLPVAAGALGAPVMVLAALLAALALSPPFAIALLFYLTLTLFYSGGLKRVALLDVFVIGVLFTLRIVMGAQVAGLTHSPWLLSFSLAFFLSLALAKRHGEVIAAAQNGSGEIVGRGYRSDDWPLTLAFGVGVGLVSVVVMLLYLTNDAAPSGFYHATAWLYAIPALITLWLMRIWLLSHRAALHDDPVVFALRDPASLGLGLAVVIAFALAI